MKPAKSFRSDQPIPCSPLSNGCATLTFRNCPWSISGRAIGILDESDVLVKVHRDATHFNDPVRNAMTDRLETLPPNAKFNDLLEVFDRGRVAIVMEGDKFLGLITRTDLLSYLRLNMPKSSVPPQREYN